MLHCPTLLLRCLTELLKGVTLSNIVRTTQNFLKNNATQPKIMLDYPKYSGTIDYIACKLDVFIIRLYGLNEHPDCCVTTSNGKNQVITYTYTT